MQQTAKQKRWLELASDCGLIDQQGCWGEWAIHWTLPTGTWGTKNSKGWSALGYAMRIHPLEELEELNAVMQEQKW